MCILSSMQDKEILFFIGSNFMIFTLNPIHQGSQTIFIQQNIFIFLTTYCPSKFLFTPFSFLC